MFSKKQLKIPALILALLTIVSLFSACGKKQEEEVQPPEEVVEPVPAPDDNEEDTPQGDVTVKNLSKGVNLTASDGNVILVATAVVPEIESEEYASAAAIINSYYEEQIEKHMEYADTELYDYAIYNYTNYPADFTPLRTEQFFDVKYNGNGYLSIVRYIVDSVGDQTSNTAVTTETFELSSGGLVTGSYAFTDGQQVKELVTKRVKTDIEAEIKAGVRNYYANWESAISDGFDIDHFFLTEDGVVFYYDLYILADAAEGMPTFVVPYDEMGDCFKLW